MDVVYTVGKGRTHEELRYSLRSLVNVADVDTVWVAGHVPNWLKNVGRLPTRQTFDRYANTSHNMRRALKAEEVSDPFCWFNDDFFALVPVKHRDYDRGSIADYLQQDRRSRPYRHAALAALQLLTDQGIEGPLNFEVHLPITVHKDLMTEALDLGGPHAWKRSVYGNLALRAGAIETTTRDDVKRREDGALPEDWVSTSDRSFHHLGVGETIRGLFPEASRYE